MENENVDHFTEINAKTLSMIERQGRLLPLAKALGLNQPTMYKWLKGESYMTMRNFVTIADYFGIQIIFPDDEISDKPQKNEVAASIELEKAKLTIAKLEGKVEILKSLLKEANESSKKMEQKSLFQAK